MRKRSRSQLRHRFYRHLFVMTFVLVVMMAMPTQVFRIHLVGGVLLQLLMLAELGQIIPKFRDPLSAWRPADLRSALFYRAIGMTGLAAMLVWMFTPARSIATSLPVLVLLTVFVCWSVQRLLRLLGREATVNREVISGAVAGYLLLGISGGLLLTVIETLQPGSFQNLVQEGRHIRDHLIPHAMLDHLIWDLDYSRINYFAFVSLTTVGYGDIVPVKPLAEMVSVLISIAGPLYLAMVMGLLISRFTIEVQSQQELDQQAVPQAPSSSDPSFSSRKPRAEDPKSSTPGP